MPNRKVNKDLSHDNYTELPQNGEVKIKTRGMLTSNEQQICNLEVEPGNFVIPEAPKRLEADSGEKKFDQSRVQKKYANKIGYIYLENPKKKADEGENRMKFHPIQSISEAKSEGGLL